MSRAESAAASTCTCGHSADWHSHDGAGDCEYDGECECQGFVSGPCPSCGQTCCAEGECCYGEGCRTSSAAQDRDVVLLRRWLDWKVMDDVDDLPLRQEVDAALDRLERRLRDELAAAVAEDDDDDT